MLSIIMVVYEVEPYVRKAIESVLAQDYKDYELILVAGTGGKDNSVAICEEYAAKDSRIKLVHTVACGVADARNRGIENVSGDYVGFVDGDDYIEPDMYSSMMNNIEKYSADIAICGRFYEFVNKTLQDEPNGAKVYTADEALSVVLSHEGFYLHCWDKLYSRKIVEGLHFDPKMPVEDRMVVTRLLGKADTIVYDSTPKYHFRERSGSLSKQKVMVDGNMDANAMMQEYIENNHPAIADECRKYMLYECITTIQNKLVAKEKDKQGIRRYQNMVKDLLKADNALIGRTLKIKSMLAIWFPYVLKVYTKIRQKNVATEYKRFA